MIPSTLVLALVGKVLAFLVLAPIVIVLLIGYIIASKMRR